MTRFGVDESLAQFITKSLPSKNCNCNVHTPGDGGLLSPDENAKVTVVESPGLISVAGLKASYDCGLLRDCIVIDTCANESPLA